MAALDNSALSTSGLISSLALSDVFGLLGSEALGAVAEICQIYSYQKNDVITEIGHKLDGIYIVKSGQVILNYQTELRHQYLSTIVMPGGCYGLTSMIPNEAAVATSKALASTKIIYIPKGKLIFLYKQFPEISICISATIYSYVKRLMKLVMLIQTPSVKGRLATWLLAQPIIQTENSKPGERLIRIPISKTHLGRTLGVRSETLSRTLGEMRDVGAIEISDKVINILKTDILQTYIIHGAYEAAVK